MDFTRMCDDWNRGALQLPKSHPAYQLDGINVRRKTCESLQQYLRVYSTILARSGASALVCETMQQLREAIPAVGSNEVIFLQPAEPERIQIYDEDKDVDSDDSLESDDEVPAIGAGCDGTDIVRFILYTTCDTDECARSFSIAGRVMHESHASSVQQPMSTASSAAAPATTIPDPANDSAADSSVSENVRVVSAPPERRQHVPMIQTVAAGSSSVTNQPALQQPATAQSTGRFNRQCQKCGRRKLDPEPCFGGLGSRGGKCTFLHAPLPGFPRTTRADAARARQSG